MQIALYYAATTCALVPYVTLTETGTPFEVHALNFRAQQQMSPEFVKLNPKHKVPLLIVDGKTLTENIAIQQWIARTFPAARLLPADPWQELQAISMMSWCAAGIHPFLSRINSPPKVCDVPDTGDSVKRIAIEALHENFHIIDGKLAGREHFFEHFTAVDAYFFWCFRRAGQLGVDQSVHKSCLAHFERMAQRASVQKVLAFEKETLASFAKAA